MRIHHVGVTVADLERSLRFYRDLLGLQVLHTGVDEGAWIDDVLGIDGAVIATADLDAGDGRIIELVEYRSPREPAAVTRCSQPGTLHLAVVVDSVAGTLARIAAAGGTVVSRRPATVDLAESSWHGVTVAYTRDPDGAIVELVEVAG